MEYNDWCVQAWGTGSYCRGVVWHGVVLMTRVTIVLTH